ncbi:MAG: acyl-CoA carboxylase subunit epsilon [Pseudonocardiaceae bacterium]
MGGEPTDEELAALVAVLARLARPAAAPPSSHNAWADPAYRLRHPSHRTWRNG